jgi:hypothetical protein
MKVHLGACKLCGVAFGSKSMAFELKTAQCLYCNGPLRAVKGDCKLPVRWMHPPGIIRSGIKPSKRMLGEEKIFGRLKQASRQTGSTVPAWAKKKKPTRRKERA